MTQPLYRVLLFLSPALAIASAIAAFINEWQTSWVAAAISLACIPVLIHLQTRRLVSVHNITARRQKQALEDSYAKLLTQSLAGPHDELLRAARALSEIPLPAAAPTPEKPRESATPKAPAGPQITDAAVEELRVTANDFRREMRMTRLVVSELLRQREQGDGDVRVPSEAGR